MAKRRRKQLMGDVDTRIDLRIGGRLANRYTIEERISSGGMATVYRARDEILGRPVAVKVMHPALAADPSFVERFRQEGQNAARLSHPNIVTVYDYGEAPMSSASQTDLFIVMELIEGMTLRSLLERFGRLDMPKALGVVRGVADALDHAHAKGIVHRDVKPENVLLSPDGQVKVVDFGIAKALGPHAANLTIDRPVGTVAYVAPEQLTASVVDARADVYALGAMTYEMLTGRPPFTGDTPESVAAARLRDPTLDASVSPQIDAAIAKATAATPDDRYETTGEFARALDAADATLPGGSLLSTASMPDAASVARAALAVGPADVDVLPFQTRLRRTKRRRFRVALAVAVVLAIAGAATYVIVPKPIAVPDLRGDTLDEAKSALKREGLQIGDINHQFHDAAGAGTIFGSDPDPGTAITKGTKVSLLVSKGPQLFAVPDIIGEPIDDAKTKMSAAGFSLSVGSRRHDDSVRKDGVISYGPPQKQAKRGTAFSAVVSNGPELVVVPDVDGKTTPQAETSIEGAGFGFGTTSDYSDSVAEGVVIRTDPAGGSMAPKGSRITAIVSKGPRPFAMPDFVGMKLAAARDRAKANGLIVRNEYPVPGSGKRKGTVQGQSPVAGTMVRKGTRIDLYYSN